jgi:mono/diheme cytochrome c family protein
VKSVLLALAVLALSGPLFIAGADSAVLDIHDPAVIDKGNTLFNRRCAGRCHGRDGTEGVDAPILTGKDYLTFDFVYATLVTGRPNTAMPSWKDRLSDEDLRVVAAFVASLGDAARR